MVSHSMGRKYIGIDIRASQIESNRARFEGPRWVTADAGEFDFPKCDMVLTCPPYGPLERYSSIPADLSTMDAEGYRSALAAVLMSCSKALLDGGAAAIVAGDVRVKGATWRIPDMVASILESAGLLIHTDLVLITRAGSAPIRAPAQMAASRLPVRTHQRVIVATKGRARRHHGSPPVPLQATGTQRSLFEHQQQGQHEATHILNDWTGLSEQPEEPAA
tara:strand:- start:15 stop:674 length:660 start_codon:yes stop_codon:yes gene_type:complete